jgi:hypothetical protein
VSDGPQHPAILATDAEREATVDRLRHAVVDGRLTLEEFSDRVGLAQIARTDQDLAQLGSDLPAGRGTAALDDSARHRAFCSRLVRSGPWERPGGTLYVRSQRRRPSRRAKLLGQGDPDA